MDAERPNFKDYGEGGDMAGARRARRAFRMCVAACLIFTGMLWFSERFLRFEHADRLYLSALTLPRDSARPMLHQAVRYDREAREKPTPKYLQALAVREEDDVILERYAEAYAADPADALFAVRYGAQLYLMDESEQAAEILKAAAAQPPESVLPEYLAAAAMAKSGGNEAALEQAMVEVARTNSRPAPLVFPEPLWFSGDVLPQEGLQYASLLRESEDLVVAPLMSFAYQVLAAADSLRDRGQVQDAKTWLEQLRLMGKRLATQSAPPGAPQAMAGLTIQIAALQRLEKLAEADTAVDAAPLIEQRVRLEQALERWREFETNRDLQIQAEQTEFTRPLGVVARTGALLFLVYIAAALFYRLMGWKKSVWTVAHSSLGKWVLVLGGVAMFILLHSFTLVQQASGGQPGYMSAIASGWWGLVTALIGFGMIYPVLTLDSVEDVSRKLGRPEEMQGTLPLARRAYRRAYASLFLRFYGILFGVYLIVTCAWVVTFRIGTGLYPWQINLLTPGLLSEERALWQAVLTMIG